MSQRPGPLMAILTARRSGQLKSQLDTRLSFKDVTNVPSGLRLFCGMSCEVGSVADISARFDEVVDGAVTGQSVG